MSKFDETADIPSPGSTTQRSTPGMDRPASEMHERSGNVISNNPLVAFLYVLMKDHITPGAVEDIMRNHVTYKGEHYSNGWLANHAQDIAQRLAFLEPVTP